MYEVVILNTDGSIESKFYDSCEAAETMLAYIIESCPESYIYEREEW